MPFVKIDLRHGRPEPYRREIGAVVYEALTEVLNVPKDDRFQVIVEHSAEALIAEVRRNHEDQRDGPIERTAQLDHPR